LIFQTLDDKRECVGIYAEGNMTFDELPDGLTACWAPVPYLEGKEIEYASLYCEGKTPDQVCPDSLRDDWDECNEKMKAFYRSFMLAQVSLDENCFFDIVPVRFLMKYCELRTKITKHVLEAYEKPKNYDYLFAMTNILTKISHNVLNIELSSLNSTMHHEKTRRFRQKAEKLPKHIKYNLFGTKTGRLTTRKSSFPIMTMNKEFRSVVKPTNSYFLELDFNAAEIRTLLALAGAKQPLEDIHAWNLAQGMGEGVETREDAKKAFFSWLYDEKKKNEKLEQIYKRDDVRNAHFKDGQVTTPFGNTMSTDRHHSLSYLIQGTTAEMVLRQAIKINEFLKDYKSFIAFTIHDSVIIDIYKEETNLVPKLLGLFTDTELGIFKVNASFGDSFGDLKPLTKE
tara:strand:- start:151 stop:1344 length:1194 start_codon:yes stop_codon:yes gene_type:complete